MHIVACLLVYVCMLYVTVDFTPRIIVNVK